MIRILLIFIGLTAGALAGWLSFTARAPQPLPKAVVPQAAPQPVAEILVAATDIAQGQTLSEATLKWAPWPQDGAGPKHILRSAQPDAIQHLIGMTARRDMLALEPIVQDRIGPGGSNPVALALSSGKRAAGVRITAESTAGGFILPNDRVDVLHTVTTNGAEGERRAVTRTILQNVLVLAIDQMVQAENAQSKAKSGTIGRTATLELTPEQSERLAAAEASGTLALVLRPLQEGPELPRATIAAPEPPRAPLQDTVRIIRGVEVETVRRDTPITAPAR